MPNLPVPVLTLASGLLIAGPVMAHGSPGGLGNFVSGFVHPLLGWDHVVALLAVGIWTALLASAPARRLRLLFVVALAVGLGRGMAGFDLPTVQTGISVSAVVPGSGLAAPMSPPAGIAAIVGGTFALLHGHAHGIEWTQAAGSLGYGLGFLLATSLLLLAGFGIGGLRRWRSGRIALRACGGVIALAGVAVLVGGD